MKNPGSLFHGEFTEFLPVISREQIRGMLLRQCNLFLYVPLERQKKNMVNHVMAMTKNSIFSNNAVAEKSIQYGNITRDLKGIRVDQKTDLLPLTNKIRKPRLHTSKQA